VSFGFVFSQGRSLSSSVAKDGELLLLPLQ
jgi:hypothetical protein